MVEVTIQCDDCQATCKIQHDLIDTRYEVKDQCPFCGSEEVAMETEEVFK